MLSLGNYRGSPFVSGHDSNTNGLTTEILDYEAGEWSSRADYPFSSDRYVMASVRTSNSKGLTVVKFIY